ncbi:hypothetical protein KIK84_08250 [Curvibacter sp. CHRR-16]|uniref:hypothetical protein n=1 Tax=Curvibacter sp. CHRR-16 TaxID=2835872 RepID=UPI001BDB1A03|nr:hypothetical protein [Curvibacter sp. CHRR-16]MBT0570315.1 hypothetical protein [Curvibacter sp. CHRR-16]
MNRSLDHLLLLLAALLVSLFFRLYRFMVNLTLPIIFVGLFALLYWGHQYYGLGAWAMATVVLGMVLLVGTYTAYALYHYDSDRLPDSVGAGGVVTRICSRFITWLGTLRYFRAPWVVVQESSVFKLRGHEIRQLIDQPGGLLQPGDILLRGFDGYVDGEFIRLTGGAGNGSQYFSHAALYVGPLTEADRAIASRRLKALGADGHWHEATQAQQDAVRHNPDYFQTGSQMVMHSMAKGVHVEDILTFLRCDYVAVIRMPETFTRADLQPDAHTLVQLSGEAKTLYERLHAGDTLTRAEVAVAAIRSGLGQIGAGYDCLFEDSATFHRFSCSEFVYYCYKSVHQVVGLQPQTHAIAGLFKRITVSPADLYNAAGAGLGKMRVLWKNV